MVFIMRNYLITFVSYRLKQINYFDFDFDFDWILAKYLTLLFCVQDVFARNTRELKKVEEEINTTQTYLQGLHCHALPLKRYF